MHVTTTGGPVSSSLVVGSSSGGSDGGASATSSNSPTSLGVNGNTPPSHLPESPPDSGSEPPYSPTDLHGLQLTNNGTPNGVPGPTSRQIATLVSNQSSISVQQSQLQNELTDLNELEMGRGGAGVDIHHVVSHHIIPNSLYLRNGDTLDSTTPTSQNVSPIPITLSQSSNGGATLQQQHLKAEDILLNGTPPHQEPVLLQVCKHSNSDSQQL